jgi:hypothetical protein
MRKSKMKRGKKMFFCVLAVLILMGIAACVTYNKAFPEAL